MTTTNFKFAQLQPFALYGAGAVAGDTSITLKTMLNIDGNALVMATDFGAKGYGTLEPGNGANEEQISFTGLTNNTNGTTTLSGVSSVTFEYPYTETSGLLKTHAGSTTFVISNTSGFYNKLVAKDEDGTITATHTYTVPNYPQVDNSATLPTQQAQLATKAYVDSVVTGGAANATTSVQGLVQLPTQAQVDAGTAAGSTGASLTPTPALLRSKLLSDYVADTGAADAYIITPSPAISAYAVGQIFSFKAAHTNTTTSTVNVNAKGAKTIKKIDGATNLAAGDIVVGQIISIEYDGTNFQMLNMPATNVLPSTTGNTNKFLTTTDGTTLSYGHAYDYQSFTSSGTWTKPSNLSGNELVVVQIWGGGGGGGGGSLNEHGAGGGGGAYVEARVRASDLSATETVTIGGTAAGGAIGANNGTAGVTSTFGMHFTARGGGGGAGNNAQVNGVSGGSGGGALGAGVTPSANAQGGTTGGNPGGGAANSSPAGYGGAGGGDQQGAAGGAAVVGGGGGGASHSTGNTGGAGGASTYGGGGGGGGCTTGGPAGTSSYGGAGGIGGAITGTGGSGSAPGGGGGGAGGAAAGGTGARGECRVWTFY